MKILFSLLIGVIIGIWVVAVCEYDESIEDAYYEQLEEDDKDNEIQFYRGHSGEDQSH